MSFIQDFKKFAFKGNLIDMAVGLVMGTAVAAMVGSFLKNIIAPIVASVFQVPDLSAWKYPLPFGAQVPKLNEAGEQIKNSAGEVVTETASLGIGAFIQQVMDFTILALVIFIALKIAARWMEKAEEEAPTPPDIELLTEIRDALKK
jgi:large conductance mechanosensitive channel